MIIRFKFCKKNEFKYLSHLDMLNLLSRGAYRAGLKTKFTCGFNPKPRITLSNPIPLGVESDAEYADFELESDIGLKDFIERMNLSLPGLLTVMDAAKTDKKIKSLMSVIDIVLYDFLLEMPDEIDNGFINSFIDIYEKQEAGKDGFEEYGNLSENGNSSKSGSIAKCSVYSYNLIDLGKKGGKKIFLLKIFGYAKIFNEFSNRIFKFNDFYKKLSGFLIDKDIKIISVKKTGVFALKGNALCEPFELIQ